MGGRGRFTPIKAAFFIAVYLFEPNMNGTLRIGSVPIWQIVTHSVDERFPLRI